MPSYPADRQATTGFSINFTDAGIHVSLKCIGILVERFDRLLTTIRLLQFDDARANVLEQLGQGQHDVLDCWTMRDSRILQAPKPDRVWARKDNLPRLEIDSWEFR